MFNIAYFFPHNLKRISFEVFSDPVSIENYKQKEKKVSFVLTDSATIGINFILKQSEKKKKKNYNLMNSSKSAWQTFWDYSVEL